MFEHISNPWDVLESEFPAMGTPAEQMRFLLNYAVLAPSGPSKHIDKRLPKQYTYA